MLKLGILGFVLFGLTSTYALQPESLDEVLQLSVPELEQVDIIRLQLLAIKDTPNAPIFNVTTTLETIHGLVETIRKDTEQQVETTFKTNPAPYKKSLGVFRMWCMANVMQYVVETNPVYGQLKEIIRHKPREVVLPIFYTSIAQSLDYPVVLASSKGHFLVQYLETIHHINIEVADNALRFHPDNFYAEPPQQLNNRQILAELLSIRAYRFKQIGHSQIADKYWALATTYVHNTNQTQNHNCRTICIQTVNIPDYYKSGQFPEVLKTRIDKLDCATDIIAEIQAFHNEELESLKTPRISNAKSRVKFRDLGFNLDAPYNFPSFLDRYVPEQLLERLYKVSQYLDYRETKARAISKEIQAFEEQGLKRDALDDAIRTRRRPLDMINPTTTNNIVLLN